MSEPTSYAIPIMRHPSQGSKCIQRVFDFSQGQVFIGDLLRDIDDGHIDFVQSIKIDNSANSEPFSITFAGVGTHGDVITAPPNSVLYCPITVPVGNVRFAAESAGDVEVPVIMYNIPMPYFTYSTVIQKTGVVTGTETNHSGTVAANAAQVAIPANPNRIRAVIQNPPENVASFWVSGSAAATEDYHSQEIQPGQQFDTGSGPLQLGDISIISSVVQSYFATEIHT